MAYKKLAVTRRDGAWYAESLQRSGLWTKRLAIELARRGRQP